MMNFEDSLHKFELFCIMELFVIRRSIFSRQKSGFVVIFINPKRSPETSLNFSDVNQIQKKSPVHRNRAHNLTPLFTTQLVFPHTDQESLA